MATTSRWRWWELLALACAAALAGAAAGGEAEVVLVDAFPEQSGFDRPVLVAFTPADSTHAYVVEQTGSLWRIPRDPAASKRLRVMNLRSEIWSPANGGNNEEGFLGLAFDPDYPNRPYLYLYTSRRGGESGRRSIVSRFEIADPGGRPRARGGELVVLEIAQPAGNHNGGTIVFGPDKMLYIALGDGGGANDQFGNGQNKGTLLAAILRIDVRNATAAAPYAIPADNPFRDEAGARPEIWAYGLRNPWRISFDSQTGELWCGDVGQNAWEEVDRITRGGNYGWPLREGLHPFADKGAKRADLIDPVAEYGRDQGASVTGGHVYRGKALPELQGAFVYADFVTGRLWAVHEDRSGGAHRVRALAQTGKNIASFAEEPDGELLAMAFDGRVYRLTGKPPAPPR